MTSSKRVGRPRDGFNKQAVSFKIHSASYEKLVAHCKEHGTTQTWTVWKALDEYFERKNGSESK